MSHDDWLLLGTDLIKDRSKLIAAYDDDSGVTAEFNRNVLTVLNNELGADFAVHHFKHIAHWNEPERRIEMRLRATSPQRVTFSALKWSVAFAEGEELVTEICTKFSLEDIRSELEAANFVVAKSWDDPGSDFLLTLAHPYC
jgi:L-histidine N-alpha-methyltransferase